jgi:uncharacterized cofD-like protein
MKKLTIIGGGTGTFVVLSGLKETKLDLTAVVGMIDSGGSTGRLRDQLGVLPPGDLRQCLVALSDAPLLWRKLFLYRFEKGDLAGHNFGNLFLSALEKVCANYNEAVSIASFVLKTRGKVVPVTFQKSHLVVEYNSGIILKGEGKIDVNFKESSGIKQASLLPKVKANPVAIKAINNCQYIIIGPGDIYTTLVPIFLVNGVSIALRQTKAKIIYIMNLMTKSGQTTNYTSGDHLNDIYKYIGRWPDYVILNNGRIQTKIISWYQKNNERPVVDDLTKNNFKGKIIRGDLVDNVSYRKDKADKLPRTILRHSPKKLKKNLLKIIYA